MNNKDIIIFIHIPKTAGNTFRNIIMKQYNPTEILNLYTANPEYFKNFNFEFIKQIFEEKNQLQKMFKIIIGHYKFGIHNFLNTQNTLYIAFLRNPFDQYISMYNHLISDSRFWNLSNNKLTELSEFIEFKLTHNIQTFLISGVSDFSILENNPDYVLAEAIKNIDKHFMFIGLTEYFDESLIIIKYKFNFKNIYYCKHNVKNSKNYHVSEVESKQILERTHLDKKLYEYAKEKLFREIKQIPFFKYRLFTFKIFNLFYILLHKIIHNFTVS